QDGILRALFDFGNLVIQTAASGRHVGSGSSEHLLVEDIAHPKKVQRLIDEVSYRVKHHIRIDRDELLKICGLPVPRLGEFEALLKRFAERLRKLLE
ncbi:MAG: hypothetical protein Q8P95_02405, partial [bacterium]|nr:hypothetical protein [bacterium]